MATIDVFQSVRHLEFENLNFSYIILVISLSLLQRTQFNQNLMTFYRNMAI